MYGVKDLNTVVTVDLTPMPGAPAMIWEYGDRASDRWLIMLDDLPPGDYSAQLRMDGVAQGSPIQFTVRQVWLLSADHPPPCADPMTCPALKAKNVVAWGKSSRQLEQQTIAVVMGPTVTGVVVRAPTPKRAYVIQFPEIMGVAAAAMATLTIRNGVAAEDVNRPIKVGP